MGELLIDQTNGDETKLPKSGSAGTLSQSESGNNLLSRLKTHFRAQRTSKRSSFEEKQQKLAVSAVKRALMTAHSNGASEPCKTLPEFPMPSPRPKEYRRKSDGMAIPNSITFQPSPDLDTIASNINDDLTSVEPATVASSTSTSSSVVTSSKLDCETPISAASISYFKIVMVMTCWEQDIRTISGWKKVLGESFLRKLFQLDPTIVTILGFSPVTKYNDSSLKYNKQFTALASQVMEAIDVAVDILTPGDLEPLEATLREFGSKHAKGRIRPEDWKVMGPALFHVLHQCLGGAFDDELKESWAALFNFMGYHILQGMNDESS